MLALGRALMARPKLLLLDEPSMGLAPRLVQEIFEIIAEINRRGTTILLVEQNAARRSASPTGPTCWRRAASRSRGRLQIWRRTSGWQRRTWAGGSHVRREGIACWPLTCTGTGRPICVRSP